MTKESVNYACSNKLIHNLHSIRSVVNPFLHSIQCTDRIISQTNMKLMELRNVNKSFTLGASLCDLKCGAGRCMIDPLFPDDQKCVCNSDAVMTKVGQCVGK